MYNSKPDVDVDTQSKENLVWESNTKTITTIIIIIIIIIKKEHIYIN